MQKPDANQHTDFTPNKTGLKLLAWTQSPNGLQLDIPKPALRHGGQLRASPQHGTWLPGLNPQRGGGQVHPVPRLFKKMRERERGSPEGGRGGGRDLYKVTPALRGPGSLTSAEQLEKGEGEEKPFLPSPPRRPKAHRAGRVGLP